LASAPEKRFGNLLRGLVAFTATAALIWYGTGLKPWWPLMWLAPVPVLLVALRSTAWAAALLSGGAWAAGMLNLWALLHGELDIPPVALALEYLLEGGMFALATLLFRALARRRASWTALLALPSFWVSFEWLLNLTWPHGTGGSLAYSQLQFLPFLQLASLTGPWGMTFLLLAFPTALALALHLRRSSPRQGYRILGTTLAVLLGVLVFGAVRLTTVPQSATIAVGLIASDGPNERVADEGGPTASLMAGYAGPIAQLARQGAAVVVLPEKTGVVIGPDTRDFDTQLQSLADGWHVSLVVGVVRVVPASAQASRARYNEARVYAPAQPVATYDKEHMLPPFESNLTPGTTLTLLRREPGGATWGVAICKDMDFTDLSRRYGRAGTGLLLVPAWDFFQDWIMHGHMALMRGVESGFTVVRAAKGGSLYVSDDRGRILGEIRSDSAPFSTLLVSAPQHHERTFFLMAGDWFAWAALAMLGSCCAVLLTRGARGQSASAAPA
jgi:apolipoprotein N-acyltransferase